MKMSFLLGATLLSTLAISANAADKQQKKRPPNIILFLVDDMGWQDTSEPFWNSKTPLNERYRTPNMERLAKKGVKFTQAYACAVCSPTRVSLMTGQNAARHRVTNWTLEYNAGPDHFPSNSTINKVDWNVNGILPKAEKEIPRTVRAKCLPAYLQDAGYTTIHCGKGHFAAKKTPAANPLAIGFDHNIAGWAAGGLGSYLGTQNFGNPSASEHGGWGVPGMWQYCGKDIFITEALTVEALKKLDEVRAKDKKPFFLYMAHYAIHCPMNLDKRFADHYANIKNPTEKAYATMIEGMDKSLGDIMNYLDKNDLTDNTILLFMSDNGGLSNHGRGGSPETHNLPLATGKGSVLEGGIRVPMIVSWPGKTAPKTINTTPVIIEDFFPTLLEIAGAKIDSDQVIDGVSLVSEFKGKSGVKKNRALVWHFPNSWTPGRSNGYGPYSAIRVGDWKYICFHEPNYKERYRLYNIKNDIAEKENLITKNPAKASELAKRLTSILAERNAQIPTLKSNHQPISLLPN